jgi:HAD superfamily hydrolase (TIGR01549 family)
MKFDCYLFDLDNCLLYIHNYPQHFDDVLVGTLKKYNLSSIPDLDTRNKLWYAGKDYINLLNKWGISDPKDFWKYFDDIDYRKRKVLVEKKRIYLFNDVLAVLNKLRKNDKKLGLISNAAEYIIEYILEQFNFTHMFHETFGLGVQKDQAIAKPSPEGIHTVLKKFGDPELSKTIMVGDSKVDIIAAKRAKIKACLIRRDLDKYPEGFENWEHQPDYIIYDLEDIFKL